MNIKVYLMDVKDRVVAAVEAPKTSQMIRLNDRYYQKRRGDNIYYDEAEFYWADQNPFLPYIAFVAKRYDIGVGMEDSVGAYPTFDEALEAAKAKGDGLVYQVLDLRNPGRFYTDGKGWSDGRP